MADPKVLFVHGLEGSPQGAKARLFAEHFEAQTPAMDTSDFEACVAVQRAAIEAFRPDVLVGSSFGGAVAVALLAAAAWRGPTLLLAQAAVHYDPAATLPKDVTVWLVHGTGDTLIPVEHSHRLAATGSPDRVRVIEVDDDHPLHASVENGDLLEWVRAIARADRDASVAGSGELGRGQENGAS